MHPLCVSGFNMIYLYKYKLKKGESCRSLGFIRDALERCFPDRGGEIGLYKDELGKPLTDRDEIRVSATHTGDIVICAVSGKEVGIDAQTVKEGLNAERIAGRFFTEYEEKKVLEEGPEAFYEIWCRKEAFSKVTGKGLSYGLKKISTVNESGEYNPEIDGVRTIGERIPEGYFACAGGEGEILWTEIQE